MAMSLLLLLLAKERGGMWEEALYGMGGIGRQRQVGGEGEPRRGIWQREGVL